MRLPNGDDALIPVEELRDYIFAPVHSSGRFKSVLFRGLGYEAQRCERLAADICSIFSSDAELAETNKFGVKYLVRGVMTGPNGRSAAIVTVWIMLPGQTVPRFVTAYPED